MAKLKYIRVRKKEDGLPIDVIILFPKALWHSTIARSFHPSHVVSAGFANIRRDFYECYGKSETLKLNSIPEEDTKLLRQQMEDEY